MKPHPAWATLTSMATAIPRPASTAIGGGARRPDDRHGPALGDLVAGTRGAGWVAGRSARRSLSPPQVRAASARPVRSSNSPAVSLEVLTQVRHDRITVRIGSLHLSRKIITSHGVHRAPAFRTRTIVSGFRMYLMS